MSQHFVFLVFADPIVVGAIQFLEGVMRPTASSRLPPHITIQGPFESKVGIDSIKLIERKLRDDIFFIGNPGVFETPKGVALYLRVASDHLRAVWDKPDYPIDKFGFNPHVTIYEGEDIPRANRALALLRRHRFELLCRDFVVTQYVPKQLDMFPHGRTSGDDHAISKLISRGSLSPSFRAAFMAAANVGG